VEIGEVLGLGPDYAIGSAITASPSEAAGLVLTFGAFAPLQEFMPTYLAALDVSSSAPAAALWTCRVADSFATNAAVGQFPVLIDTAGARRLAFPGLTSSTFFVGEP
jgi:hypothetical protein